MGILLGIIYINYYITFRREKQSPFFLDKRAVFVYNIRREFETILTRGESFAADKKTKEKK